MREPPQLTRPHLDPGAFLGFCPNGAFVLHDTAGTIADLVDAGGRVFVHRARAEHRAPLMAAAYLVRRGADPTSAIRRASAATGGEPSSYLAAQVEAIRGD